MFEFNLKSAFKSLRLIAKYGAHKKPHIKTTITENFDYIMAKKGADDNNYFEKFFHLRKQKETHTDYVQKNKCLKCKQKQISHILGWSPVCEECLLRSIL